MWKRTDPLKIIDGFLGKYPLDKVQSRHDQKSAMRYPDDSNIFLIDEHSFSLSIYLSKETTRNDIRHLMQNLGSVTALFYGEIYNLDELWDILSIEDQQKSDISFSYICCLLYKHLGYEFAKKINGIFSIILWDRDDNTLLLIADRFGLARPIFYRISNGVIFSNKLRLLMTAKDVDTYVDSDSLALFMKYSYIPAPKTIFKGVEKLNHGEMLICKGGYVRKKRYLSFEELSPGRLSSDTDDLVEEYLEVLERSAKRKMNVDDEERIGCFLSGGLDSSACVAIASRQEGKQIKTFGIGFDDDSIDERPFARMVAQYFNVPFYDYVFDGKEIESLPEIVWGLEEPFLENGLFLTYAGLKAATGHVDMIMAGDGCDQLYGTGGFASGRPIALRFLIDKVRLRSVADKMRPLTRNKLFYRDCSLNKMKVMLDRVVDFNDWFFWGFDSYELSEMLLTAPKKNGLRAFSNDLKLKHPDFSDYYKFATVHQDIEHYACQNVLVKSFRLADMLRLTVREVYLDNEVIDFLMKVDVALRRKGTLLDYLLGRTKTKYLHRLAMRNILPPPILTKPKQGGFVPMAVLMKKKATRLNIYAYILRSRIIKEFFNIGYVKRLLSDFEELCHKPVYWQSHRDSRANRVLYLLDIAIWYDIVIEKRYTNRPTETLTEFIQPS